LGARSSVFLPYQNLGLVIVDEEHESTYKQYDPAPRYHARDTAIYLAALHGAKVLLGTATPSVESYYNAKMGKYGLVEINERYQDMQMPEIIVANTKEAYRKKQMKSFFSPQMLENIQLSLGNGEQVILFKNRRGYAPYIECNNCNWIPYCTNCDVTLTYHKQTNDLTCHYCGFSQHMPTHCKICGQPALQTKGYGTEKIEDELSLFFPDAKIQRMDLDSTRSKKAYEKIIHAFEEKEIDILVGTQMITKGLDFDNVSLVGVLNADGMLNYPDFRAHERSYQLMAQVSGRAGRKNKRGKVVIQASDPAHPVITDVRHNNYKSQFLRQLDERRMFKYPPFYRLIALYVKHKDKDAVNRAAHYLAQALFNIFGNRVNGPEFPLVERVQNLYQKNILLKIESDKTGGKTKNLVMKCIGQMLSQPGYGSVKVLTDVDPQ
jgi:primosomal protein N' (replication factor Y) (superfamily II helicase)